MQTVYDWVTLAIFAGLIVLMLHRSTMTPPPDKLSAYLPPAIGCAAANYAGNEGYMLVAVGLMALTIGYIVRVLKPGRPL